MDPRSQRREAASLFLDLGFRWRLRGQSVFQGPVYGCPFAYLCIAKEAHGAVGRARDEVPAVGRSPDSAGLYYWPRSEPVQPSPLPG